MKKNKVKEPKVWELQPGIYVLYCPHCGKREIWNLNLLGSAGNQSLDMALAYHQNKTCIKEGSNLEVK